MSVIETIQQQVADQLTADPFFANIAVLVEHLADVQSQFDRALGPATSVGGKSGAVVVILTPTANVNFENVFGPFFDDIPVVVLVAENPLINQDSNVGTQQSALMICEKAAALLHQFFPEQSNGPLVAVKPTIVRGPNAGEDEGIVQYNMNFRTMGGLRETQPQLDPVGFQNTAGTITLSQDTQGAAIFYTLDGTNPSPRNGTFYTAPFTPGTGITIKARAWLAGYLASNTTTVNT